MAKIRRRNHAIGASYDQNRQRLVMLLHTGVELTVPVRLVRELQTVRAEDLSDIEITSSGLGLYWPRLDAYVHIPSLLKGLWDTNLRMKPSRQLTESKSADVIEALATMPDVGEDTHFVPRPPYTRDFRETARQRVLRDPDFADALAIDMVSASFTAADGNVFLDLGFPPEEAQRLKAESDQRNAAEVVMRGRDSTRDIDAELLESIRLFKAGVIGKVHHNGPPETLALRCVDVRPLGDVAGHGLSIGKIYLGRPDGEGCVRLIVDSGKGDLYPLACFEVIPSDRLGKPKQQTDDDHA